MTKYFYEGITSMTMSKNHKDIDNDGNQDNHYKCDNGDNYNIVCHTVIFLDDPPSLLVHMLMT